MPTREYLQSSGWVDDEPPRATRPLSTVSEGLSGSVASGPDPRAVGSVRSGSGFWAAGHRAGSGTSSSAYTAFSGAQASSPRDSYGYGGYGYGDPGLGGGMGGIPEGRALEPGADAEGAAEDVDHDSQGTEIGEKGNGAGTGSAKGKERARRAKKDVCDEAAAQDAFIAGMIYSLGQRILPGAPYTPSAAPYAQIYGSGNLDIDKGRWKLEDCLRSVLQCLCLLETQLLTLAFTDSPASLRDAVPENEILLGSPMRCSERGGLTDRFFSLRLLDTLDCNDIMLGYPLDTSSPRIMVTDYSSHYSDKGTDR